MSRIHLTVSLCGVVLFAGCAGTLDDPSIFDETGQGAGGNARLDGGTPSSRDGGSSTASGDGGSRGGSTGGSGGSDGGGTALSCDFKALMQSKCGSSGCHGAPALSTGLDLTSEGLAARVKDKQASGPCSDYLLIDPDNPERSALYVMTTDDTCGAKMPLGGTLSSAEQTCILQWIENL